MNVHLKLVEMTFQNLSIILTMFWCPPFWLRLLVRGRQDLIVFFIVNLIWTYAISSLCYHCAGTGCTFINLLTPLTYLLLLPPFISSLFPLYGCQKKYKKIYSKLVKPLPGGETLIVWRCVFCVVWIECLHIGMVLWTIELGGVYSTCCCHLRMC